MLEQTVKQQKNTKKNSIIDKAKLSSNDDLGSKKSREYIT